jgi:hypothetical protein
LEAQAEIFSSSATEIFVMPPDAFVGRKRVFVIRTLFPILVHLIIEPNFSEMIHWLSLKPYFLLTDFLFLTATINLPWQSRAAFSLNAASGAPYNITTGRDNNGDGAFNDRPRVVATTQSQAILTQFGALDPGAVNGNLRRNAGTNPANSTLDLNLSRTFAFGRSNAAGERPFKLAANVRASNLLNRANLLGVNGALAAPFFGRANATGPARRIEAGLRFSF